MINPRTKDLVLTFRRARPSPVARDLVRHLLSPKRPGQFFRDVQTKWSGVADGWAIKVTQFNKKRELDWLYARARDAGVENTLWNYKMEFYHLFFCWVPLLLMEVISEKSPPFFNQELIAIHVSYGTYIYLLTSWCQLWGKWRVNVDEYTPLDRERTDSYFTFGDGHP